MSGRTARNRRKANETQSVDVVHGFPTVDDETLVITSIHSLRRAPVFICWGHSTISLETDGSVVRGRFPISVLLHHQYESAGIENPINTIFVCMGNSTVAYNEDGVFYQSEPNQCFKHITDVLHAPTSLIISGGMGSVRFADHAFEETYYEHPREEALQIAKWTNGNQKKELPPYEKVSLIPREGLLLNYNNTLASYENDEFQFWGVLFSKSLPDDVSRLIDGLGADMTFALR